MAKTLIIGGTRFLGPSLIDKLLKRGDEVTVLNRGNDYGKKLPVQIRVMKGDRTKLDDLRQLSSQQHDYIYDMCCYDHEDAEKLLRVIKPAHLIFFSTAAVYAEPQWYPLSEESVLGPWNSFGSYGVNKAQAEADFAIFAKRHGSKLTIFRPVYLLGDGNYFDRENYYFSRIANGLPILVPGSGNALMQFAFLEETAQVFADIPVAQRKNIEVLNVGGDQYVTIQNLIDLHARFSGRKARNVNFDPKALGMREEEFYDDVYPFPNLNFIVSNARIKESYGVKFLQLEAGLATVYAHWVKHWDGTVKRYPSEEKILKRLGIAKI